MVKFAIVGCGHIAKKHAEAIMSLEEAELYAVCDVQKENIVPFLTYGCKAYTDFEEMLEDTKIDVVNICTPSGLHASLTIKAAQKGKHVIVEKPMSLCLSDAEKMIKACSDHHVKLAVVHLNRFRPAIIELKKALDENRFGKISHVNATIRWNRNQAYYDQANWRGTKAMDGGVLMNQAIHNLDLLLWLLGDVIDVKSYTETRIRNIESEDVALAILRFHSGVLGVIEAATTIFPKNYEESISIFGETGSAIISGPTANWIKYWNFDSMTEDESSAIIQQVSQEPFGNTGHFHIIQDMVHSIIEDREPVVSGEDGKRAVELVLSIYDNANNL